MSFVEPIVGIFSNDSIKCMSVNTSAECFLFQHEAFKHLKEYHWEKTDLHLNRLLQFTIYELCRFYRTIVCTRGFYYF